MTYAQRKRVNSLLRRSAVYLLLVCMAYVVVYPLIGRLFYSVMSEADVNDDSVRFFAKHFTLDNYKAAIEQMDYWRNFASGILYIVLFSVAELLSSTMIAYGFARFSFPGNRLLFCLAVLTLLIPLPLYSLPLYFQFRTYRMLNTMWPILLLCLTGLGVRSGLIIFVLHQYFADFPRELDEAASIDGSGPLSTFIRIVLPSSATMLVTCLLLTFVWQYLDSGYVSIYMPGKNFLQIQVQVIYDAVANSMAATGASINMIERSLISNAAVLLFILPLVGLYIVCQRFFVESIERTGIVG